MWKYLIALFLVELFGCHIKAQEYCSVTGLVTKSLPRESFRVVLKKKSTN